MRRLVDRVGHDFQRRAFAAHFGRERGMVVVNPEVQAVGRELTQRDERGFDVIPLIRAA